MTTIKLGSVIVHANSEGITGFTTKDGKNIERSGALGFRKTYLVKGTGGALEAKSFDAFERYFDKEGFEEAKQREDEILRAELKKKIIKEHEILPPEKEELYKFLEHRISSGNI